MTTGVSSITKSQCCSWCGHVVCGCVRVRTCVWSMNADAASHTMALARNGPRTCASMPSKRAKSPVARASAVASRSAPSRVLSAMGSHGCVGLYANLESHKGESEMRELSTQAAHPYLNLFTFAVRRKRRVTVPPTAPGAFSIITLLLSGSGEQLQRSSYVWRPSRQLLLLLLLVLLAACDARQCSGT